MQTMRRRLTDQVVALTAAGWLAIDPETGAETARRAWLV